MTDRDDQIAKALQADTVIPRLERSGPLNTGEILASQAWFNARRRRLMSTGGRPTNPNWSMRRQVPLAPETWDGLKELAGVWSTHEERLGPGQVAAFLLEDAVVNVRLSANAVCSESSCRVRFIDEGDADPRFTQWHQPGVFAGANQS